MPQQTLLMIVNPRAGRNKSPAPLFDAAAILCESGYLLSIHRTTAPGDAASYAAREGGHYDVVVAVGGDGTLNEVACGLMQLQHPPLLGYLPQGSTNDFAASLRISSNPAEAAQAIVRRQPRMLDVGRWNQRHFIYVASFGAFTSTSYTASQAAKNALGHYRLRIQADGDNLDGEYLFGAVCNSTSIGGLMKLDPERVVLDDGRFELLLIRSPKTPAELQNLVLAMLEQRYDRDGVIFRHVRSLHLETEEDLPWSLDGEYAPSMPSVDITNCQQALTMLL